ncbi:MAG: methylenetetrahydrofolate reductase C-terminal domain-containing protein [Candidatus Altiarchaeota archaeon]|nr:methylenetetrahydrofolate reductase C-terminal domain-containing protein [Candidatus Altiarchaeota archaeon]
MIITEAKPIIEVIESIGDARKVLILGCGKCATSCETGGIKQVKEMCELLEGKGFIVSSGVVDAQCDERLTFRELKKHEGYDCIVSMACGSGVAALADLTEKHVVPSNNTLFVGVIKPGRIYEERCSLCGECMLAATGGICPQTRCSKGLLHGPCGGSSNGYCEVDNTRECAWIIITKRLRKLGRTADLNRVNQPRKCMHARKPRAVKKK